MKRKSILLLAGVLALSVFGGCNSTIPDISLESEVRYTEHSENNSQAKKQPQSQQNRKHLKLIYHQYRIIPAILMQKSIIINRTSVMMNIQHHLLSITVI